MVKTRVIVFLILASIFATVHHLAMAASLYWYYWWFDLVMHFWGGILIGLGVHSFATFKLIQIKPRLPLIFASILVITVSWEVFEWFAGLYDPATYLADTAIDIAMGFSGGLLAHFLLTNRYNTSV